MKKVIVSVMLGLGLSTVLLTGCGGDKVILDNAGRPYDPDKNPVNKIEINTDERFSCMHFRYVISNSDVLTTQEMISEVKKVYTWADGSGNQNLYDASRGMYSAVLNWDMDSVLSYGKIIGEICKDIPNP